MSKREYRVLLIDLKEKVKLSKFAKELGLNQGDLSAFLNGKDTTMSLDNLKLLYTHVINYFRSYEVNEPSL